VYCVFSCQTVRERSEGRGSDCGIRTRLSCSAEWGALPSSREFVDHPGGTQLISCPCNHSKETQNDAF
jgi:hypothetical protein